MKDLLKNFDYSSFKKMKPPGDNTFDTMQEIKEIARMLGGVQETKQSLSYAKTLLEED